MDYNNYLRSISAMLFDSTGKGVYWMFNDEIVAENWVYDQFGARKSTLATALEIQKRFVEKYGPTDSKG